MITPSGFELDSTSSDFEVSSNCSHQNEFQEENDFSSIVGRTIELMNEMKSVGIQLKQRTDFLKSQYLNLADEVLCFREISFIPRIQSVCFQLNYIDSTSFYGQVSETSGE